jgi:predicted ABC-class ATPase
MTSLLVNHLVSDLVAQEIMRGVKPLSEVMDSVTSVPKVVVVDSLAAPPTVNGEFVVTMTMKH